VLRFSKAKEERTMADVNERDTKLIQYLNEAYGKEKELETALEAHIGMTERAPYKKRLQTHLRETKGHWRKLDRRIKKLGRSAGSSPQAAQTVASKAAAAVKGPVHALRGTGAEERQLKNARTEYSEEAEEIAMYTAIETFAESVGDRDTAKVAREIRRDEERMAKYLQRLIPTLSKAVVRAEVPSDQRPTSRRRTSRRRPATGARSGSSRRRAATSGRRSGSSRSRPSSGRSRSTASGRSRSTTSGRRSSASRGRS
jgi:ferritin-like metal-binding protein YciE